MVEIVFRLLTIFDYETDLRHTMALLAWEGNITLENKGALFTAKP